MVGFQADSLTEYFASFIFVFTWLSQCAFNAQNAHLNNGSFTPTHVCVLLRSKRDKRREKKGDKRKTKSNAVRSKGSETITKGRLKNSTAGMIAGIAPRATAAGAAAASGGGYATETKTKFPTCRPNSRINTNNGLKRRKKKGNVSSFIPNANPRYSNTGYAAPYPSSKKYINKQKYASSMKKKLGQMKAPYPAHGALSHVKKAQSLVPRNAENVAPAGLRTRFANTPKKQLPQIEDGPPYAEENFKKSPFYVEPIPKFGHEAFTDA